MHGPNEAETAQPAGTGLDLAIIRGLVEAHAGSVVLEATHQLDGELVRLEDRGCACRRAIRPGPDGDGGDPGPPPEAAVASVGHHGRVELIRLLQGVDIHVIRRQR